MKNNTALSITELTYGEIGTVGGGGIASSLTLTVVASGITIAAGGILATPFLSATVIAGIASGVASYSTYNNGHNAVLSGVNKMTAISLVGVMTAGAFRLFNILPNLNVVPPEQGR